MRGLKILLGLALAVILLGARGYWNATRDPIVRLASIKVANWPKGAPPVKVLLISDVHIAGPDMPPSRMIAIVEKLNALKPEIVLVAGDLISDKRLATHIYTVPEALAPLAHFKAPLGVVVVMGNHDHWHDEAGFQAEIPKAGLILLANSAIKRGPLVIGGVDDDFTHHANIAATYAAMDQLEGPRIVLTHSPDIVPKLPARVALVAAGHTHCGQAFLPFSDQPISDVTRYGARFRCGHKVDKGQDLVVTGGLGTSGVWMRFRAPPDAWLITLGPSQAGAPKPGPAR
jgi:uncharacterized protein